jgi:hypothetical protein
MSANVVPLQREDYSDCGEIDAEDRRQIAESYPAFCSRMRDRVVPEDLIPGLIPGDGFTLIHGQPRSLKTWLELELARAMVTGTAPFGVERFTPAAPLRAWFATEEDPDIEVYKRFQGLFAGRNGGIEPAGLHVTVQRAMSLDDPQWQQDCIDTAKSLAIEVTFFDPLRSFTSAVDQGPDKLRPFVLFLRRYVRETGSRVILSHHDTKPPVGKADDRPKPQRASGGGIFSIADAPIHVERLGLEESRSLITPSYYKFSVSPEPFIMAIESDDPKDPTWVRLRAEDSTVREAQDLGLHARIVDYLREHPHTSGTKVATGVHAAKAEVLQALGALRQKGRVDFQTRGQANLWAILAEPEAECR